MHRKPVSARIDPIPPPRRRYRLRGFLSSCARHGTCLILSDLLAWRDAAPARPEVLFWRASTGQEVDLVVEHKGRLLPIEVKTSTRPRSADTEGIRAFRAEYGRTARAGLLLHGGSELGWIADGVLAAPWWRLV